MLVALMAVPFASQAQLSAIYEFSTGVDNSMWYTLTSDSVMLIDASSFTNSTSATTGDGKKTDVTNIGFTFTFAGVEYTQFSANSDGTVRLGETQIGTSNYTTPFSAANAGANAPKICGLGCDGCMVLGDYIAYQLFGNEGSRVAVIEISTGTYNSTTRANHYTFQIQLAEADNSVTVVYSATAPAAGPNVAYQLGASASANDIVLFNVANNTMTIHNAGVGTTNAAGTWPEAGRYYTITPNPNACIPVTGLAASNVTADGAVLTWADTNNTGATYTIYNMADSTIAAASISDMTYTLTGLASNTSYNFAVVTNCSADNLSNPAVVSFRTACGAMALPWTCGFETEEIQSTTDATALPWCSQRYVSVAATSGTTYPYSYSSSTYAHQGSRSLYYYGSTTASYPDTMAFILPQVDVTAYPMNGNRVTFWARMGAASNSKNVYVCTMSDPADLTTLTLIDSVLVSGTTNTKYSVSLANSAATNAYVVLAVMKGSGNLYMDDVTLEEMPSCLEISNLAAGNITTSSVELTWSDAANASATYTVYNMADTSVVATGVTGTTYTVTGLNANTQYNFGVAANCPAGDASIMTVSTRTACAAEALPFSETFDASLSSNPCWAGANILYADGVTPTMGANSNWTYTSTVSNGIEAGHYRVNIYGTSCYKWLITPAIDLTTATNPMLTFDAAFTVYSSTSTGPATGFENNDSQKFMVLVSTNNGQTWTVASDIPLTSIASGSYLTQYVNLAAYAGETVRVAFYAQSTTSGGDNNLHIDNIAIDEVVGEICYPVTGLAASNITTDGATLTWTGDAASYNVYVIAADTTLVQNVATTTLTLTGLTAMTQYTYGVRAVCTSSESDMVSVTFATACSSISLPFTETFEATSATTGCWTTDGPGSWLVGTGDYSTTTGAFEGSFNAKITHGSNGDVTKLISPELEGVTNGLQLTFAHIQRSWAGDIDNLAVYYRTSSDAAWQQVANYTDAIDPWTVDSVTISGTVYQIAFEYTDNYGYGVGIDSVVFAAVSGSTDTTIVDTGSVVTCDPVAIPYTETFSGNIDCWTVFTSEDETGIDEGNFQFYYTYDAPQYLISPELSGTTDGVSVSFQYWVESSYYPESFQVGYSTTTNDTSAFSWGAEQSNLTNTTATVYSQVMPAGTKFVAIRCNSYDAFALHVDSVVFDLPPACMPVTDLAVDSVTATSVFLSWNGTAASYSVIGADGTVVASNLTATSYEVTGLTAATAYTFGVVAHCSATETSDAVTVSTRTTCVGESCNVTIVSGANGLLAASIDVMQNGALVATVTDGSFAAYTESVSVCSGSPVTLVYHQTPYADYGYDSYISFTVADGSGATVYTCTSGSTMTDGATFATLSEPCPSCIMPVVTLDATTTTTATISWTGTASSYSVYNGATHVTNVTANTYTFTGLTAGTAYTFGVVALCATDDSSAMATVTAQTECDAVTTLPYSEGFENGLGCWTTVNGSADGQPWTAFNASQMQGATAHAGVSVASSWSWKNTAMHANAWLVSPQFTLPTVAAGDTLLLSWWNLTNSAYPDSYSVMLSTTTADTAAFTTTLQPYGVADTGAWTLRTVDLTAYAGQSIYVAFHHVAYDMNYLFLDDISVSVGAAPVPAPDTLTVTIAVNDATMGSTTPTPGTYQYLTGDTLRVSATPNTGYVFNGWNITYGDGTVDSLSASYASLYAPAAALMGDSPITFLALFGPIDMTSDSMQVNVAVNDPTMGTTVPAPGTHYFHVGEAASVVAVPNTGYHLTGWTINVTRYYAEYDTTIVGIDTTIALPLDNVFDLFGGWVVSEDNYDYVWNVTANFAVGTAPVTPDSVTVITSVNDTTMGSITPAPGTHYYTLGDTVLLSFQPNPGYYVYAVQRSMTHPLYGTIVDETITDTAELAEMVGVVDTLVVDDTELYGLVYTVNVIFAAVGTQPNIYNITVGYDITKGTVTGDGPYVEGSSATLNAIAFDGNEFVAWVENGDTVGRNTVYTIDNISADHHLTAVFVTKTGIEDVDADNVDIYSTDDVIVVRGAEGKQVVLFDVNGRVLSREARASERVEFRVTNNGVYLVKVADAAAKRVVVIR